ncbi:MAG: hydantoinase/oxoprolinase family protein [Archaeoglobaceae archaeon]
MKPEPVVLGIDTGGTMTDTVLVAEDGSFVIGKAQTTPANEAEGIINSLKNAVEKWGLELEEVLPALRTVVYTGTIMLNRVLERRGLHPLGIITTAGFEDTLRMGRSRQAWNTLSYEERLHAISHFYPEPLVPRNMIIGVRERTLLTGVEIAPLYERDVEEATRTLIKRGAKAIIVMFLNSWANPSHETQAEQIIKRVSAEIGKDIPVFLSHKIAPVLGELRRLNAVVIQVYASEASREQFAKIESSFREKNCKAPLYILTNYGTVVPPTFERLIHTVTSGPTGGAVGVKTLAELYGFEYVIGTDVGGTSFDVTAIIARQPIMAPYTVVERFEASVPSIKTESIGAGTGSFVRVDPVTKAVKIGPQSAGYRIGVCWEEGGIETVTINDAMLVLGYLNPDYFLGGEIKLNKKKAEKEFERQIAEPLGIELISAAWNSYTLVSERMKLHLESIVRSLGLSPENFHIVSYGGGGPSTVVAYTSGLKFAGVMIPEIAPAFSAWGATLPDLGIRVEKSVEAYVPPLPGVKPMGIAETIMKGVAELLGIKIRGLKEIEGLRNLLVQNAVNVLSSAWKELRGYVSDELKSVREEGRVEWKASVRMLYAGMLDDIEIDSPSLEAAEELIKELCERFDDLFERVYATSARSREFGYTITRAVVTGYLRMPKPRIKEEAEVGLKPSGDAFKGEREIFWEGKWHNASIYEMGKLKAGNLIEGPAVIEAPASTFVIPPTNKAKLDKRRIFWLEVR